MTSPRYGRVVNTNRFDEPTVERFKLTDMSAAFFATGNVAIARARLLEVVEAEGANSGPFDALFDEYGWEDLELGERLRTMGSRIVQCPEAVVRRFPRERALHPAAEGALRTTEARHDVCVAIRASITIRRSQWSSYQL